MTKEFLTGMGIEEELAEAILNEAQKEGGELQRQLSERESELVGLRLDCAVNDELRRYGAKNNKAVKALLNMDSVSLDGEVLNGLIEQLEQLKEENGFLFGGAEVPKVVAPSGGGRGKGFGFKFTGVR